MSAQRSRQRHGGAQQSFGLSRTHLLILMGVQLLLLLAFWFITTARVSSLAAQQVGLQREIHHLRTQIGLVGPAKLNMQAQRSFQQGARSLVFQGATGAPGNGDEALAGEMMRLLSNYPLDIVNVARADSLLLSGKVSRATADDRDHITIVWSLQDTAGAMIGEVVQKNEVPRGKLDGAWNEDAHFATQGAKDGLLALLINANALR